ncbi:hypothetical protein HWV62_28394 [Athelia sp. TMB]|nr:hypothetical protein HWV62_28394 [Athelia sp. TMB]
MSAVVEGIPILLHVSVFLFFGGLVDFLYPINHLIAWITLSAIAAVSGLYVLITILPVLDRKAPFRTPLSELCWAFLRFLGVLRYRSDGRWKRITGNMQRGREVIATAMNSGRSKRDFLALSWTLQSLTEDKELAPFIEGIPDFCNSEGDSQVMRQILMNENARLVPRLIAALRTCQHPSSPTAATKKTRIISGLDAIAHLSRVFSANPWEFVRVYEPALCSVIVPLTESSDHHIASAATHTASIMLEHIYSHILLYARQEAVLLSRLDDFHGALKMFCKWDSSLSLCEMIPSLVTSTEIPPFGHGTEPISVCPAFKKAILQRFGHLDFCDTLQPSMYADLDANKRLRRLTLAFLGASFYTAPEMISKLKGSADTMDYYQRTHNLVEVARTLTYFTDNCSSKLVSQYATCVATHIAVRFQRAMAESDEAYIFLVASHFSPRIKNEDMRPIRDVKAPRNPQHEIRKRDVRLYDKLPAIEQAVLLGLPGADGSKSLGLCRGHVHLLLDKFRHPSECVDGALELAARTIQTMEPYLNARFSCHRDQARLLELCKAALDGPDEHPPAYPTRPAMVFLLQEVISTISDPSLVDEAVEVLNNLPFYNQSPSFKKLLREVSASLCKSPSAMTDVHTTRLQLKSATTLEPLEDDEDSEHVQM